MTELINYVDWHCHPFRAERWFGIWNPALDRAASYGATGAYMTRDVDDPLHFRQVTVWERKEDFERFWYAPEISALREASLDYYNKPVLPVWHSVVADARTAVAAAD
jgi:hypothetical protein